MLYGAARETQGKVSNEHFYRHADISTLFLFMFKGLINKKNDISLSEKMSDILGWLYSIDMRSDQRVLHRTTVSQISCLGSIGWSATPIFLDYSLAQYMRICVPKNQGITNCPFCAIISYFLRWNWMCTLSKGIGMKIVEYPCHTVYWIHANRWQTSEGNKCSWKCWTNLYFW